ncbi:putative aminopeptidase y protein [Drechmeria coniospora]|uniref:Peptide hydrolase n=1 Tax=Drechmeria coniospora TaxID=98403 RepID=A0A151GK98_DRECN|nr:putative aminopeptidase y protein [Drechmeria coniospora]KYK57535.1 putative aminopeptidase y protein [Drechmeria coniospora]ODA79422.1 hypothetical protein RJ55_05015 [Drechmeria coniospora]
MKLSLGVLCTSLLGAEAAAARRPQLTPEAVAADVDWIGLKNVLGNLYTIAKNHGGNRAFGLPGYRFSMDYVLQRVRIRFDKYFHTEVQEFTQLYYQLNEISLAGPEGQDIPVFSMIYNAATPRPHGITAPLINIPVDDDRGSACFADQWNGIDASGKIALIKRGKCSVDAKAKLATAHGALAVIIYSEAGGINYPAYLTAENAGKLVPIGGVGAGVGSNWSQRLAAGEQLKVRLIVDAITEPRRCWNIISETREGDPNNVVLIGTHLDSVPTGPGINDNGSGIAALLEMVNSFRKFTGLKNKIRFAWWGAEEVGLVGSSHYASSLNETEADKIRLYMNFDTIGSRRPNYTVEANDDADRIAAAPLLEHLLLHGGLPAKIVPYSPMSSNYYGFIKLGIPTTGITAGTMFPLDNPPDPCFHEACDDIDNVSQQAVVANSRAAAYAAAKFALSLDGVPARNKTTAMARAGETLQLPYW